MNYKLRQNLVDIWNWYYKGKSDPIEPKAPVIKDIDFIEIAKDTQYKVLPSIKLYDKTGTLITRWRFDLISRIILLFTGNLYIHYMTFHKPIQPLYLDIWRPDLADPDFKKKLELSKTVEVSIEKKFIQTRDFMQEIIDQEIDKQIWS
jgi:hypothetical protein